MIPPIPALEDPLMAFRFSVVFLGKVGVDHPLDLRFQQVDGLGVEVETEERGKATNFGAGRKFPKSIKPGTLTLKRGMPLISTLRLEILDSFDKFRFKPRNVMVNVLDEGGLPISNWIFREAYPISWSLGSLDATSNSVLFENLQLTYATCKRFSL